MSYTPVRMQPAPSDGNWDPARETHEAWRRRQILEGQRWRRGHYQRIDYYPGREAAQVIERLMKANPREGYTAMLDRIIAEWGASQTGPCFRNKIARNNDAGPSQRPATPPPKTPRKGQP